MIMNRIICKALTLGTFSFFLAGAAVYAQSPTDTSQQPPAESQPMAQPSPSDSTMPTQDTPPSAWHGPDLNDPNLNLTQDQKDKITKIQDETHAQAKSVKSDTSLTDEQRHSRMKEIHRGAEQQIMQVLTPEQQKTWKSMNSEMKREKSAPAAH